jgi:DNA-binding NarL/FixJ family response regulator
VKAVATIVLGDDHAVFLDALSTVLAQHGHSVGVVALTAAELVSSVRSMQPEVCLISRHLDVDDLADVISRVIAASAGTRVIVLSSAPETGAATRALDAGASGFVHKSRAVSALISAVDRVLLGNVVVDVPEPAEIRGSACAHDVERLAARLTIRERECLSLLVEGLDTAAMAAKLGISRATVRTYVQAVLSKLGVHSRLEAASFAVQSGILDACYDDNLMRNLRAGDPVFADFGSGRAPQPLPPRSATDGRQAAGRTRGSIQYRTRTVSPAAVSASARGHLSIAD